MGTRLSVEKYIDSNAWPASLPATVMENQLNLGLRRDVYFLPLDRSASCMGLLWFALMLH